MKKQDYLCEMSGWTHQRRSAKLAAIQRLIKYQSQSDVCDMMHQPRNTDTGFCWVDEMLSWTILTMFFLYVSVPWQCNLLGSQWDSHKIVFILFIIQNTLNSVS